MTRRDLGALIEACVSGDARCCGDVVAAVGSLDPSDPERDGSLDRLATAAADSASAVDALVQLIYRERFVRSEIRKVLIGDVAAAEEALQETALAMVRALPQFRGESTFRTWVSSIARNQAIAVLRRARPSSELLESDGEVARFSSTLALRSDLEAAMGLLSEPFRSAVRMRDIEQLSYEEIASVLGIELNTVRSRLSRGRAKLAVLLEPEDRPSSGGLAG